MTDESRTAYYVDAKELPAVFRFPNTTQQEVANAVAYWIGTGFLLQVHGGNGASAVFNWGKVSFVEITPDPEAGEGLNVPLLELELDLAAAANAHRKRVQDEG